MTESSVILLAAGASTRMGIPKPLMRFKNTTWLQYQLKMLQECGLESLVVVLGHHAELIQSQVRLSDTIVCLNEHPELGQFSSIQCGLKAIKSNRYFIQPVDVPVPSRESWDALLSAPLSEVVQLEYRGKCGHPILISNSFKNYILESPVTSRLDALIRECANKTRVTTSDPKIIRNLNTPEDFQEYLATL